MVAVAISNTGSIQAQTQNLALRSPVKTDAQMLFDKIFNDQRVMNFYASGKLEPLKAVQEKRIDRAVLRSNSMDPWHMLMVFEKNKPESQESFVGFVVAGHGEEDPTEYGLAATDKRKFSEVAIALAHDQQKKGYGKELIEAISEIAKEALKFTQDNGLVSLQFDTLVATASPSNPGVSIFKSFVKEVTLDKKFTDQNTLEVVHKTRFVFTKAL